MAERVAITGVGIITALGQTVNEYWQNLMAETTVVEPIPVHWLNYADFHSNIWSPLPEIDFNRYAITEIEKKQLDMTSLLTIGAAAQALESAGLTLQKIDAKRNCFTINRVDHQTASVFLGTGIGGVSTLGGAFAYQILNNQKTALENLSRRLTGLPDHQILNEQLQEIISKLQLPKRFNPFAVSMIMPNAPAANLAIRFNLHGLNHTFNQACASGTTAIGKAFEAIQSGKTPFIMAGGVEYLYDDYGALFYAFDLVRTLVKTDGDRHKANKPFDKKRSGFLYSQGGAAVLILEEFQHAQKRGAPILCEIAGYAETNDGNNIMVMDKSGVHIETMIRQCLANAGITTANIDYINAHGTGTLVNDEVELNLIHQIFGKKPLINSTKSLLGHTLGASGAIEAVTTVLSIQNKQVHTCLNLENPLIDLNYPLKATSTDIRYSLSQSFGFGGHNAGLIFKRV